MNTAAREFTQALIALLVALVVGWAGSQQGATLGQIPVMLLCVLLAFAVQWLVFLHAWKNHTEKFFDLTGSLTYLTVLAVALLLGNGEPRSLLIAALVASPLTSARDKAADHTPIIDFEERGLIDCNDAFYHRYDREYVTHVPQGARQFTWVSVILVSVLALGVFLSVRPDPKPRPKEIPADLIQWYRDLGLELELREILKEKGLREADPFEELIADAAARLPPARNAQLPASKIRHGRAKKYRMRQSEPRLSEHPGWSHRLKAAKSSASA